MIDQVEPFAFSLNQQFPSVDIIINHAAWTVRMPDEECQPLNMNDKGLGWETQQGRF